MAVPPEYDIEAAQQTDDWANVLGAPDQLHDVATRCAFLQEVHPDHGFRSGLADREALAPP
jgi:hypothetical protein